MEKKLFRFLAGGCFALFALIYLYPAIKYHYDFWNWLFPLGYIAAAVGLFLGKYLVSLIGAGVTATGMMYMFSRTLGQISRYTGLSGPVFGNVLIQFLRFAAFALVAVAFLMAFLSKPKPRKLGMIFAFAAAGAYFLFLLVLLIRGSRLAFFFWVIHLAFVGGAVLTGLAVGQSPAGKAAVPAAPRAPAYPRQPQWQAQPMYPAQPQQPQWQAQPAYPAQPQWQAPAQPAYPAQPQQPQWQAQPAYPAQPQPCAPPAEPQPYSPPVERAYAPPAPEPVNPAPSAASEPVSPAPSAAPGLEQLKPLQERLSQGLITPEEYEAKRREIMGR